MQLTEEQRKLIEDKLESYRLHYNLTDDHIESKVINSKIEVLEFILEILKMNHDYKYEQMYQEGHMSEEERNGLIPAIRQETEREYAKRVLTPEQWAEHERIEEEMKKLTIKEELKKKINNEA